MIDENKERSVNLLCMASIAGRIIYIINTVTINLGHLIA